MKWTQYTLKTTTEATDMVSYVLSEIGVEGIEIDDNIPLTEDEKKQMFVDIINDDKVDDGTASIKFYRDPEEDPESFLFKVQTALDGIKDFVDIGAGTIEVSETEDLDWINNWKQFFHTFRATQIIIRPAWETDVESFLKSDKYDPEKDMIINIDPGAAFGTGSHETTRLCMGALEKYVKKGQKILDVGCGSGILSIVAIKFGAEYALGIDIDEHAIGSTIENRNINNVTPEEFEILCGNIIDDTALQETVGSECYDIAVANILANVIIPLSAEIGRHIKPGGLYITSGIIDTAADDVRSAIEANGFTIVETVTLGEWYCFVARKS